LFAKGLYLLKLQRSADGKGDNPQGNMGYEIKFLFYQSLMEETDNGRTKKYAGYNIAGYPGGLEEAGDLSADIASSPRYTSMWRFSSRLNISGNINSIGKFNR
jgi:hypothetical protein